MPTIVSDCLRCGAKSMTFDVTADVYVGRSYDWQTHHEAFAVCRRCGRSAIIKLDLATTSRKNDFIADCSLTKMAGDLEPTFRVKDWLNIGDLKSTSEPPDHVPQEVAAAFREGAKCMAIGCFNAAAAMFRLALDLTTKPLLPESNAPGPQPTKSQRYNLYDRIEWLIEQGKIASALQDLAHCVRKDGNDGAHDGSLVEADAADLLDFSTALLERLFTEPERLRIAKQRQEDRRKPRAK